MKTDIINETAVDNLEAVKKEIDKVLAPRRKVLLELVRQNEGLAYLFHGHSVTTHCYVNVFGKGKGLIKFAWYQVYGLDGRSLTPTLYEKLSDYCGELRERLEEEINKLIHKSDPDYNENLEEEEEYTARHPSWKVKIASKK